MTWEKGRQLKKFDNIEYTYNANGIRTSKTINGVKHEYTLDGTKILRETWGDNTLVPLYDNEDSVCGILYNDEPYYFVKNLQGDVIAIVNKDAETVVQYSYDAWGACTNAVTYTELTQNVDIAAINPFRYRSYYFDREIGLYYLQSRYYNPIVGRFANADESDVVSIVEGVFITNLYLYVHNYPVDEIDVIGMLSRKDIKNTIQKILGFLKKIGEVLLKHFGISTRNYKRRNKYKNAGDLKNFVYENRSNIKKMNKGVSHISKFVEIVFAVIDCHELIRNNKNACIAIAEVLFYGFWRLLSFGVTKLISFIVEKVNFFLKYIVEKVLEYLFDKYLGIDSKATETIKTYYLKNINTTKMDIDDYFIAIFKGTGSAIASAF